MRRIFVSLMLTLTAFIANAQPSAIAPRAYQQMLKKGIDVDWWGRSEKNKRCVPALGRKRTRC